MDKKRLVNCTFLSASSFTKLNNDSKLIYIYFLLNADDRGFVANAEDILAMLGINYDPLQALVDRSLLIEFRDKLGNQIFLIRHWFKHNNMVRGLWTNYKQFYKEVDLIDNEYHLKKHQKTILRKRGFRGIGLKGKLRKSYKEKEKKLNVN